MTGGVKMWAKIEEFKEYGSVLQSAAETNTELFCSDSGVGWRLAELPVVEESIAFLSLHDNTPEVFIPLEGTTILKVAKKADFSDCKVFLIDRPLMIDPGVWHGLACVNGVSRLLLVENREVHLEKKKIERSRGE